MNTCELLLIGATHRTAPLGLREKFSLSPENEAALAADLAALPGVRELVILNTCNRVEIYVVGGAAVRPAQIAAAFCACQGFDPLDWAERENQGVRVPFAPSVFPLGSGCAC